MRNSAESGFVLPVRMVQSPSRGIKTWGSSAGVLGHVGGASEALCVWTSEVLARAYEALVLLASEALDRGV